MIIGSVSRNRYIILDWLCAVDPDIWFQSQHPYQTSGSTSSSISVFVPFWGGHYEDTPGSYLHRLRSARTAAPAAEGEAAARRTRPCPGPTDPPSPLISQTQSLDLSQICPRSRLSIGDQCASAGLALCESRAPH